jgi:riboflavin biosynthesis pyrimidine reductase
VTDVTYRAAADLSDDELLALYPWPQSGTWVRAMMVETLDGAAAGADGLSGSISSPVDQRVFNTVRRHADVVLIGAGTMRAEQYTPMRAKDADAEARTAAGQLPAPVIAVVSRSLELPWNLPVWSESTERPLVITGSSADPGALAEAEAHAEIVALDQLVPEAIIEVLGDRDLGRILCEGGPRLLRDLTAAGLVDEADITISPLIAGTGKSPETGVLPVAARFGLAHVLTDDDHLMVRYVVEAR